ncbi:solute carrier family 28 member 3 [Venturia canescens]|uniref:solute carrier family 28 member 3 n=1 Tax=Venturia canescens TaxID=32260 RepID=UPI001C9C3467|nr:solute carrier family 28 member 3 [Venturia canescens]
MAGINNPTFDEVERKISKHSLRISLNLGHQDFGLDELNDDIKNRDSSKDEGYSKRENSSGCLAAGRLAIDQFFVRNKKVFKRMGILLIHASVIVYLTFASIYWTKNAKNCEFEWCDGYGMLIVILSIVYFCLIYYCIIKKYFGKSIKSGFDPLCSCLDGINNYRYGPSLFKGSFYGLVLIAIVVFLILDTVGSRDRLTSFIGIVVLMFFGWVFSKNPGKIYWQPVIWGLILQFSFGLITIRWSVGRAIFQCVANKVAAFLGYAKDGAAFVFSQQIIDDGVFAFAVLPVIFFFSFIIQILYYWGAMQWVILKLGWMLQYVMGTTVCESLNSAANTFLGMTESPLLIKPYISKLTKSELHAIMCSGFASVSGTVLAAYIGFGAQPAHLITASVMSAPAALCFSKLFYPETEKSQTTFDNIPLQKSEDTSVMDAATKGALAGIPLVLGIVANIVAFVSLISFLNAILSWLGGLVGFSELTFELILSKVFMPLSWIIGVPWDQCEDVATLIGLKSVVNEFVAYQKLGELKKAGKLTPRVEAIATYAICGFANPGSIGIMMGSLGSMAPEKRQQIAELVVRAFVAGSIVCFLSACTAGMLMDESFFATALTNGTTPAQ